MFTFCLLMLSLIGLVAGDAADSSDFAVVSVRGCPIFVRRVGSVRSGSFAVSPAFCIVDASSFDRVTPRFDPTSGWEHLTFPVVVNDPEMLPEAKRQLMKAAPGIAINSIAFDKVSDLRVVVDNSKPLTSNSTAHSSNSTDPELDFIWSPAETSGSLRLGCNRFTCLALAWYVRNRNLAAFDSVLVSARMSGSQSETPATFPIFVANATRPIKQLQRRILPVGRCSAPSHFRDILVDSCRVRVYKQSGRKGHFLLEPLLCNQLKPRVEFDYKRAKSILVVEANVKDDRIANVIKEKLGDQSALSVTFMDLWDAQIFVKDSKMFRLLLVSQRGISYRKMSKQLRLTADRTRAELRIKCPTKQYCETLRSVLLKEPVDFWQSVGWNPVIQTSRGCLMSTHFDDRNLVGTAEEFNSESFSPFDIFPFKAIDVRAIFLTARKSKECFPDRESRQGFSMRRITKPNGEISVPFKKSWSFDFLRSRIVTRAGRRFIVFQQRGCSNTVGFQRRWKEYEEGFGDNLNFWLGLSTIHALSRGGVTMRYEMKLWNGGSVYGEYTGFQVFDSSTNYTMLYTGWRAYSHGYDALRYSNRAPFSTLDRHSNFYSSHLDGASPCSKLLGSSGWWFGRSCTRANPNGIFCQGETSSPSCNVWHIESGFKSVMESRLMLQLTPGSDYDKLFK